MYIKSLLCKKKKSSYSLNDRHIYIYIYLKSVKKFPLIY